MAFLSDNINAFKDLLGKEKAFYKLDCVPESGINQIFFFDPDGNIIEISNCAPKIGEIKCDMQNDSIQSSDKYNSDGLVKNSSLNDVIAHTIVLIFIIMQIIHFST